MDPALLAFLPFIGVVVGAGIGLVGQYFLAKHRLRGEIHLKLFGLAAQSVADTLAAYLEALDLLTIAAARTSTDREGAQAWLDKRSFEAQRTKAECAAAFLPPELDAAATDVRDTLLDASGALRKASGIADDKERDDVCRASTRSAALAIIRFQHRAHDWKSRSWPAETLRSVQAPSAPPAALPLKASTPAELPPKEGE